MICRHAWLVAAGSTLICAAFALAQQPAAPLQPAGGAPPAAAAQQPAKTERKAIYDEQADAKEQIAQAVAKAKKEKAKTPILTLFRRHWLLVLLAALTFAGNNAAGYMTTGGYLQNYATTPVEEGGLVGMERTPVLLAVAGASIVWLIMTFAAGIVSDRIGRRNTYIIGWIAFLATVFLLFPLANTGNPWLLFLGVSLGLDARYKPNCQRYLARLMDRPAFKRAREKQQG